MPHIHTNPGQHDFTASAFIVRLDMTEPSLLLHMHKKLGKYYQFGGHVELHENLWEAVVHEITEESGYEIDQLKILQPHVRLKPFSDAKLHPQPVYIQTHRFTPDMDHYHTDITFAFVTSEAPKHDVGEGESSDLRAFTLSELRKLSSSEIVPNVQNTGIFVLEKCLPNWEACSTAEFS